MSIISNKMAKLKALETFDNECAEVVKNTVEFMQDQLATLNTKGNDKSEKAIAKQYAKRIELAVKYALGENRKSQKEANN